MSQKVYPSEPYSPKFRPKRAGVSKVEIKPFAFVLMPFSKEFDDIYKLGIQALCSEMGIVAERVDEQRFSETILERIYRQIRDSDFIIADLTGRNENVFYEVGYAHALGKKCTLLTQAADDIPFDLKHHRHVIYGRSINALREQLQSELAWMKGELEKSKNSPFTTTIKVANETLTKTEYDANASLNFVIDIKNMSDRTSPGIEAMYFEIGEKWEIVQDEVVCPSTPSESKGRLKYFIRAPVARLLSGGWAQIKLGAKRRVWSKWTGDEYKEKYTFSGNVFLEIATSGGTFVEPLHVTAECEEIPF